MKSHQKRRIIKNISHIIVKKYLTKASQKCIIIKHSLRAQTKYRGVEQLVARRAHNPKVVGSSPSSATINENTHLVMGVFLLLCYIDLNKLYML